jgi:hypothetical protein
VVSERRDEDAVVTWHEGRRLGQRAHVGRERRGHDRVVRVGRWARRHGGLAAIGRGRDLPPLDAAGRQLRRLDTTSAGLEAGYTDVAVLPEGPRRSPASASSSQGLRPRCSHRG